MGEERGGGREWEEEAERKTQEDEEGSIYRVVAAT